MMLQPILVNQALKQPTKNQTSFTQTSTTDPTPAACELISGNLPSILPASHVSAPKSTDDDSIAALI